MAWNTVAPMGSPMYHLFDKIKNCRMALVAWSRNLGKKKDKLKKKTQRIGSFVFYELDQKSRGDSKGER